MRQLATVCASIFLMCLFAPANADIESFRIVSGEFPPFDVEKGPESPGALTEIVELLSRRVGQAVHVEYYPWQRALIMPLKMSRVAVLPLTRTPEREKNYAWLVYLYHQEFVFFARDRDGYDLSSFDALRKLRVGAVAGSAGLQHLKNHRFANLIIVSSHRDLWRMLNEGLIDALYGGKAIELHSMKILGMNPSDFRMGAAVESGDIWMGGAKDFTQTDVDAFTKALAEIRKDGSFGRILKKYDLPEQ